MFDQIVENLRKATDATVQMQQEMFKKWTALWPGMPPAPTMAGEQILKVQKKWMEAIGEQIQKQRETMEAQFNAGLRHIEEGFRLAEAKDAEELRTKTVELWQKMFECLRQAYETQVRDFQAAAAKWGALFTKGAA